MSLKVEFFLEFDDNDNQKEVDASLFENEPVAANPNALSSLDDRLKKLIGDVDDTRTEDIELNEVASHLKSRKKKAHPAPKAPKDEVEEEDLEDSDKTSQLEEFIRSKIPRKKTAKKPQVSFLDLGEDLEVKDQAEGPKEITSEDLPSVESLRKKLSDDEPQL